MWSRKKIQQQKDTCEEIKCKYGVYKRMEYGLGNGFKLLPDSIAWNWGMPRF